MSWDTGREHGHLDITKGYVHVHVSLRPCLSMFCPASVHVCPCLRKPDKTTGQQPDMSGYVSGSLQKGNQYPQREPLTVNQEPYFPYTPNNKE